MASLSTHPARAPESTWDIGSLVTFRGDRCLDAPMSFRVSLVADTSDHQCPIFKPPAFAFSPFSKPILPRIGESSLRETLLLSGRRWWRLGPVRIPYQSQRSRRLDAPMRPDSEHGFGLRAYAQRMPTWGKRPCPWRMFVSSFKVGNVLIGIGTLRRVGQSIWCSVDPLTAGASLLPWEGRVLPVTSIFPGSRGLTNPGAGG
ncbi:hypothetical protein BKA70DRAFT_4640 [Coprinopsis sp. MPI-PUGE-AT-0042]|nr:hypothetical protein BKA70DRAFT_4640 [Coprinopsis sp. MPI-PUGE-AT-0042]